MTDLLTDQAIHERLGSTNGRLRLTLSVSGLIGKFAGTGSRLIFRVCHENVTLTYTIVSRFEASIYMVPSSSLLGERPSSELEGV